VVNDDFHFLAEIKGLNLIKLAMTSEHLEQINRLRIANKIVPRRVDIVIML
jgi:hypothetical protein